MHDCGFDFPQHWIKLDTTGGSRPLARHSHAACCIAGPLTGQKHPLLLVGEGFSGNVFSGSAFEDTWLLDVDRGMWSDVSGLIYLVYNVASQLCVISMCCCLHTCGCVP